MSCSKLVHAPQKWVKVHQDFLRDGSFEDKELIGMQEMVDWLIKCGVADETATRNMFKRINAYVFLRCWYPVLPPDSFSRKMFKLSIHFLVALFLVDDTIEQYNQQEMAELCDAYDTLEEQIFKSFPKCPSITELQESMKHLKTKYSIAANTMMMDFVNRSALYLLEQGKAPKERVMNFRRRLSNSVSLFYQSIFTKEITGTKVTENEIQWRRGFDGMAFPFYPYPEIFTHAIEGKEWPIRELTELYTIGLLYSITINDMYSFHRDSLNTSDSVVKIWLQEKIVSDLEEARFKTCKVLDAIMQNTYERIENMKRKYPNSFELHELLNYTAYLTAGMIYVHNTAAPRYYESPAHVVVVEVEDKDLSQWVGKKDEEAWAILRRFEETMNTEKGVMAALCGDKAGRAQFVRKYVHCTDNYQEQ